MSQLRKWFTDEQIKVLLLRVVESISKQSRSFFNCLVPEPGPFVIRAIQNNPMLQPSTKHQYIKAIENYLATGESLTDTVALAEYALTVGCSMRSFL